MVCSRKQSIKNLGNHTKKGNIPPNKGRKTGQYKKCLYCSKEFYEYPSEKRKFCSRKCKDKGFIPWNKNRINLICQLCKKEFYVSLSHINQRFCSIKCKGLASRGIHYSSGTEFKKGDVPWNNGKKGNMPTHWSSWNKKPKVKIKCGICKKIFEVILGRKDRAKYCSLKCKNKALKDIVLPKIGFKKGDKHLNWMGGISFEPYGTDFNDDLRLIIRFRDNFTCQLCGLKENGRALDVHHIDYNKKNNPWDNLITLCIGCHRQAGWDRKHWTNFFKEEMGWI